MHDWLPSALAYVGAWLRFQMRHAEQPGATVAIHHGGAVVYEEAFGLADLTAPHLAMTPRHRVRVASHSKSFTAAGILKLREQGRIGLEDPVGRHVEGLHDTLRGATIGQLLSHSAGVSRDGLDGAHWLDERAWPDRAALTDEFAVAPTLEPNVRFKYSNMGYALLGLVIEAVTGEAYGDWMVREIIAAAGLEETAPDMPLADDVPMARGHSAKLPLGRRVVIPGDSATHAMAPATGFVSTAADLARFFAQLNPDAPRSLLAVASRREMVRHHWRAPHSAFERHYGLGVDAGSYWEWPWFGHGGGFQGFLTRTTCVPHLDLTISIVTNAIDGWATSWVDGVLNILQTFSRFGAPTREVADWTGRWWTIWGAVDLVPMGQRVLMANPVAIAPLSFASEIEIASRDEGRVALANGFASHGERVWRVRNADDAVIQVRMGAAQYQSEEANVAAMQRLYMI